ncbi:Sec-independent protein translocase protein TatB [Chitinivorax sp. PXF-14]|uniref:Sec-independent protein translocase protein TatB n=1 Tax=Chitinivorax sp. PXF-14 TaxID=3230488 RepID=UPI0034659EF4
MFDISFGEMVVIGAVALVVIGPERLPKVARTLGHLVGRAQRYVAQVKADVSREIELDELRKVQGEISQAARQLEQQIHNEVQLAQAEVDKMRQEAEANAASIPDFSQQLRNDVLGEAPPAVSAPVVDLFSQPLAEPPPPVFTPEETEFRSRQLDLFADTAPTPHAETHHP